MASTPTCRSARKASRSDGDIDSWPMARRYRRPMTSTRPAREDDAPAIAHVWHEAWGDGHTGHVPDGLLAHRHPEHFAARAAERVPHSWVAEVDGGVVGFVTVEGD